MTSFKAATDEYRQQLLVGAIQAAYRGLIQYVMDLRTFFATTYPDYRVSGSVYQGTMDMTYFALVPEALKQRGLKVAVVFVYETFRFEVWLAGVNKQVQAQYWRLFKDSGWDKYRVVPTPKGFDSIVEGVLVENPDFGDLDGMTRQIESGTLAFLADVGSFLAEREA